MPDTPSTSTPPRKWRPRRLLATIGGVAIILLALAVLLLDVLQIEVVKLPRPRPLGRVVALPQNWPEGWAPGQRQWFHHATQGTTIMPVEWLASLERPELRVISTPRPFLDADFMSRFGFLPSAADPRQNPDGRLPIGFAITHDFNDPTGDKDRPHTVKPYNAVGLTCAACHTGRMTVPGSDGRPVDVLVDGGSAMLDIRGFQTALGTAVGFTLKVPFRFARFAGKVLKDRDTSENRKQLRAELESWLKEAQTTKELYDKRHVFEWESGVGRTDALSLIGNRVFGPLSPGNVAVASAPVNFPMIWDTAWFDWVQYNGSIKKVMVRNIGEALGVGARTNVTPGDPRFLKSTVDVANLSRMEDQLGGKTPFSGLRSPKWNDAVKLAGFRPIDGALADRGKLLYETYCLGCHGPSVAEELEEDRVSPEPKYWTKKPDGPPPYDQNFLKTPLVDLGRLGTDPAEAADFHNRFSQIPDPDAGDEASRAGPAPEHGGAARVETATDPRQWITVTAAKGLRLVTERIRATAYADLTPAQVADWDRFREHRPNMDDFEVIVARLGYKARPLDGVWATPPYLHNGSVPSLDALLKPVAARPKTFPLASTAYDPTTVGYSVEPQPGDFILDTSLPGNYNTGHEFRDLTLVEIEAKRKTLDFDSKATPDQRWAKLFGVSAEEYAAMSEADRRERRRQLTIETLDLPKSWFADDLKLSNTWFFGVIGPGLDEEERQAIIEYLKTL